MTLTKPVDAGARPTAASTTSRTALTHTISVGGTPFAYRELGPRTGVPLVLLHHFAAVLDDWDPRVIDGIATKRHVIAFDNRGIGASGGSVPYTIDEIATDAVAFIRALGYDQVDLLGFSLGGGVAQVIALERPELVRRIILAGTGPAGGGGIEKINRIAAAAYTKGALTLSDPRHYLFFNRNAKGKRAATEYMARLKERTATVTSASHCRPGAPSSRRFAPPAYRRPTTSGRSRSRSSWPTAITTSWSRPATRPTSRGGSRTRSSPSTRTRATAVSFSTTASSSPRSSSSSKAE